MKRFPIRLTVATALAFVVLCGLGAWQVKRLQWKTRLLAHIAALQTAPAIPIAQALSAVRAGRQASFTRVSAHCLPGFSPLMYRFAEKGEAVAWRALTVCRLAGTPGYDGIVVDLGLVDKFTGQMEPAALDLPAPVAVTGILREVGAKSWLGGAGVIRVNGVDTVRLLDRPTLNGFALRSGLRKPAPLFLAVERETPPPAGVTPEALPADIPNNHLVYALTWFALAGILLAFYVSMLRQRRLEA